jgi:hypothetical protein
MRAYSAVLTIVAWFAVIAQLVLIMNNSTSGAVTTFIRFISFFTILTNTLVAICFTSLTLSSDSRFKKTSLITAITVYITIVGIVYNLLLRQIWDPQGLQKVVDELLHTVVPVLCIIYFIVFVPGEKLPWKSAFAWLIYPLVYSIYTLIRGAIVTEYPYPFIDVSILGYGQALINCFFILVGFLLISFLAIRVGRLKTKGPA